MISILLSGITVFTTHALEAVTGFGCTVLAIPFVSALLGVKEAIMVLTVLAWILALYIAITKWKDIDFKQYAIITFFMLLGLPIGIFLYRTADLSILKVILAIFIICTSLLQLLKLTGIIKINKKLPKPVSFVLLVLGGIVHGMFSSGGPLVVLYATQAIPDKGRFRATLCLLWATLNSIIISTYIVASSFTQPIFEKIGWMIPFLVAGIIVGEKTHNKLNPKLFSIIVFSMLFVTGLFMLAFR